MVLVVGLVLERAKLPVISQHSIFLDPAQKRVEAPDASVRVDSQILDSCSSSQIHLWSKSKI